MYTPIHIQYSLPVRAYLSTSELAIQMLNNLIYIGLLFSCLV